MKFKPPHSGPSIAATMAAARSAEASGRLGEAQALCRQILARQPHHPDATLLLAKMAAGCGQDSLADRLLRGIIERTPDCVEALVDLADLLRGRREYNEAIYFCQRAIAKDPKDSHAYYVLGVSCIDCWLIPEAVEALRKSVELNPGFWAAFDKLGQALNLDGRVEEAIQAFRKSIELSKDVPTSYVHLGSALSRTGNTVEADELYDRAEAPAASSPNYLMILGYAHQLARNWDRAEKALRETIKLAPTAETPQLLLSQVLQESGRFEESRALVKGALPSHPASTKLYSDFAFSGKVTSSDRDIVDAMSTLVRATNLSPEGRAQLCFALGKALDDLGDYESAIQHFREGNELGHTAGDLAKERHSRLIDSLISTQTKEFFEAHKGQGSESEEPVFVVGMLRSGTTLTEQMLSSHPKIGAIGESTYLPFVARRLIEPEISSDPNAIADFARSYLRHIRSETNGEPRIIDKLPDNFMYAGLIHLAFPNARIIHCRRNPVDTCLSIFVNPLAMAFTHSIEDITFAYHEYERLMDHWRTVLPANRFFELSYEDLVTDRERVLRRTIEFLGLEWDDSVLRHEANKRAPMTLSKWQVRQPIYKSAVERWRNYEPWIPDLIAEFSGAGG